MPIVKASLDHLVGVRALLESASYRYTDFGTEDLPTLLARGPGAIGEEAGHPWGYLGVGVEERPATLPVAALTRAHIRALLFRRRIHPDQAVDLLLPMVDAQLKDCGPVQLLCYGNEPWLIPALARAGFDEVEQVQFYQLDRLPRRAATLPPPPAEVELAPGRPDHLEALAQLDAAAFPPLWHFGTNDLFEMLMRCRMQLAWWQGQLAGYAALCANNRSEGQLARLAVHPDLQGRGVGRALLADAIHHAAQEFAVLVLNTQVANTRSQKLYRGFGFRTIGLPVSVLARQIG